MQEPALQKMQEVQQLGDILPYNCGLCNMLAANTKNLIEQPYNVSHAGENLSSCEHQRILPVYPAYLLLEI